MLNLVLAISAHTQLKFDKPVLITKENGLPVNQFPSVKKGEDGFIWIGSSEGLCRFDGSQVKVFREGKDLRYSLFDNGINSVQPAKDHVWIGTDQGLSVLNTKNYTFRHYQLTDDGKTDSLKRRFDQPINTLYKDKTGKIWIGTRSRGVGLYDEVKDNFRFFSVSKLKYPPLIPSLGPSSSILSFEESRTNDSIIWAGTTAGLQEINRVTGEVRLFTFPQKSTDYQVALNAFRRLYHHDDGLLYVGSWGASVNIFDRLAQTFTRLRVKNQAGQKILNSPTSRFIRKSDHEMWISTSTGVVVYDSRVKDVTWYKFNDLDKNEFYAVDFIDENNRAWHQDINGLSYFDPAMQQFARYSFKHLLGPEMTFAFYILSDESGNNLTVCPRFAGGIFHFDKLKKEWTRSLFKGQNFLKEENAVRGIEQLQPGEYIISSNRGLFLYSEKKGRVTSLQGVPPFSSSTRGEIKLDRTGNLWISDDTQGLVKWNPTTTQYRIYQDGLFSNDTSEFHGRIKGGSYGRLNNFFEDSRGNMWFQRNNGIGVYISEKDSIVNFIYAKNEKNSFPSAQSFAEDKKGRIWIISADGWLGYSLSNDPARGVVYKFNIRDRGMQIYIQELATDKNGDVWGYNTKELVKINASDLSFTTFSFQYGVGDADFFHFSFLPSGEMVFGGRNDIVIANPADLKRNAEIPAPYIDGIEVLNQPFNFVLNGSPLRLRHKQNFFSIKFSAKAFTMSKDVRFRYRLNGFDEWTESTARRFANYTNVPGGDYVFQLQAANNEGVWNQKIIELPVHIATPFWLTWWFRAGAIAAVIFVAYQFYRNRLNQVKKKQKLKSDYEKKLANVEMSALLAQMNPHFLFNSLNSIDSYIIRNESKKASEYLNNFARLMRLILQNSRSNYISLKDELEALDLYMQMESLRFKNKFGYSIALDGAIDANSIVIPPMLIQPYVENAIWHGLMHMTNGDEGFVRINISRNADDLLCVIEDNGIGRKKATEIKARKQKNHKRSMGMQITRDRIEIINKLYNMNASVHIYDKQNEEGEAQGTKVELKIPV